MPTTKPTPILLDTDLLSGMVTEILAIAGAPKSRKAACLNRVAALIIGPRQSWGVLTARAGIAHALGVAPPAVPAGSYDLVLTACLLAMHEAGVVLGEGTHLMARRLREDYLRDRNEAASELQDASEICKDILDNHTLLVHLVQMQAMSRRLGTTKLRPPSASRRAKAREIWWHGQSQLLIENLSRSARTPVDLIAFLQSDRKSLADWLGQKRSKSESRWFWAASWIQGARDIGAPTSVYESQFKKLLGPDTARKLLASIPQ